MMSYMIFRVYCTKCKWSGNTSFGMVGMTQIATPISQCPECHGDIKGENTIKHQFIRSSGRRRFILCETPSIYCTYDLNVHPHLKIQDESSSDAIFELFRNDVLLVAELMRELTDGL